MDQEKRKILKDAVGGCGKGGPGLPDRAPGAGGGAGAKGFAVKGAVTNPTHPSLTIGGRSMGEIAKGFKKENQNPLKNLENLPQLVRPRPKFRYVAGKK